MTNTLPFYVLGALLLAGCQTTTTDGAQAVEPTPATTPTPAVVAPPATPTAAPTPAPTPTPATKPQNTLTALDLRKPDYAKKGFWTATADAGGSDLRIETVSALTGKAGYYAGKPNYASVRYDADKNTLSYTTTGKASTDRTRTASADYTDGVKTDDGVDFTKSDGKGNREKRASIQVGTWLYSGHAQGDKEVDEYSQALSFYGGEVVTTPPSTGRATYRGGNRGSVYVMKVPSGYQQQALKGTFDMSVDFEAGSFTTAQKLTAAGSGEDLGHINGAGTLSGSTLKGENVSGEITMGGQRMNVQGGGVIGLIGGAKAEEVAGLFRGHVLENGSTPEVVVSGSFLGKDVAQ